MIPGYMREGGFRYLHPRSTAWQRWRHQAPRCRECRARMERYYNFDALRCPWGHNVTGLQMRAPLEKARSEDAGPLRSGSSPDSHA